MIKLIKEFLDRVNIESGKAENRFNLWQLDQQLVFKPGEVAVSSISQTSRLRKLTVHVGPSLAGREERAALQGSVESSWWDSEREWRPDGVLIRSCFINGQAESEVRPVQGFQTGERYKEAFWRKLTASTAYSARTFTTLHRRRSSIRSITK